MGSKMKNLFKKSQSKLVLGEIKDREYYYQKNEEQLQREKIVLDYDYIRSLAR